MILQGTKNGDGFEVKCIKTKKPRMSNHFGRTWQCMVTILVSWENHPEEEVNCYMDNTWSSWYYFKVNGQWYKINGVDHEFMYHGHYWANFSNERIKK